MMGLVGVHHQMLEDVLEFTEYGKIKEYSYYMALNSPYLLVSGDSFVEKKQKKAIINCYIGKIIFDSKEEGLGQVFKETFLISEYKLVVSGVVKMLDHLSDNQTISVFMFNKSW